MKRCLYLFIFLLNYYSLAYSKEIVLTTLDWEPYIGKNLKNNGPLAEVIKSALENEGYSLKLIFLPWVRAVNEAAKGHDGIDGYFPEYYDNLKEDKFIFSNPFFESKVGFYINKKNRQKIVYKLDKSNLNNTYKNMYNLNFGVVRGYINEEIFDANQKISKIESTTDEKNLLLLNEGRVDVILIDEYVAKYYLKNNPDLLFSQNKFLFLEPPLQVHKLYIAWSKLSSEIPNKVKIFNQGLDKLIKSGELIKILKKYEEFK